MAVADKRIENLVKLTKGRSKTDRTLLYRHIAHLIIQRRHAYEGQKNGLEETKILFELFDALSRQVDAEIRIELAQDLSRRENPPEELTKRLAIDEISIAESVLKFAPFKEETLLNIIKNTDKAHHLVITERKDLSQKLWQTIVDNREGDKKADDDQAVEKTTKKSDEKSSKKTDPTQLIHFPRNTNTANQVKKRAVDLFVPSNDKTPPVFTPSKEMPPIPAFFLGKPPSSKNADKDTEAEADQPTHVAMPITPTAPYVENAICWSVDSKGEITEIDKEATDIFGLSFEQLIGNNLWQLLDITANSDIYNAVIKRHPIRNIIVKTINGGEQVRLIGHARFEIGSGRFIGFDGTIKLTEDNINTKKTRTVKLKEQAKPSTVLDTGSIANAVPTIDAGSTSGHILAAHLSADASVPIQDMLEGIQRIARTARRNKDEAMLTDIRAVMSDCFKLRDMVEDTDRIARMFGGGESVGNETFDVFKVLNSCLDDDTTRHGNILHFQLMPQTTNPTVRFSRNILRQAFARMLEMARESNLNTNLIPIYVHPVEDGRLEVAMPLGALTGDKSVDSRDLDTDDRLKLGVVHRKRSGDPVMTASLGLSTLSNSIERLGGRLDIIQNYQNSETGEQTISTGSVGIRLPLE